MSHLKSVHLKNVHLKYVLSKICPSKKRRGALSMTSQSIKLKLGKQVCSDQPNIAESSSSHSSLVPLE